MFAVCSSAIVRMDTIHRLYCNTCTWSHVLFVFIYSLATFRYSGTMAGCIVIPVIFNPIMYFVVQHLWICLHLPSGLVPPVVVRKSRYMANNFNKEKQHSPASISHQKHMLFFCLFSCTVLAYLTLNKWSFEEEVKQWCLTRWPKFGCCLTLYIFCCRGENNFLHKCISVHSPVLCCVHVCCVQAMIRWVGKLS